MATTLRACDGSVIGSYRDLKSGCQFVYATPTDQPAMWQEFLQGALESYARHGVQSVLEYDKVRDGASTRMFIAAVDPPGAWSAACGRRARTPPPAGARHLEWAGQPGEALLWGDIEDRLPFGVVEMKSGWVSETLSTRAELSAALARVVLHSMRLLDAQYALCTVAQHAVRRWETTGARVSSMIPAVPYPDDRYQTVPMWWDLQTAESLTEPQHWSILGQEWAELTSAHQAPGWAAVTDGAAA